MVAIVSQVSVGVFASYFFNSRIHTAHKLIYVVEAQSAPSVVLARLNQYIGILNSGAEHPLLKFAPLLFATVESPHIVHIHIGYFFLSIPFVAGIYHLFYTGVVSALQPAKNTLSREFAGFFRRDACFYKFLFYIYCTSTHLIGVTLFG